MIPLRERREMEPVREEGTRNRPHVVGLQTLPDHYIWTAVRIKRQQRCRLPVPPPLEKSTQATGNQAVCGVLALL
jgi:hypothetical protein